MKHFLTCVCILVSMQLYSSSADEKSSFLITEIRDYHVPTDTEITEVAKSFQNRISPKWGANKLVMPKTPTNLNLKIIRIDTSRNGKTNFVEEFRAYKGCRFSLGNGTYRLLNDHHVLKIEERISDNTSSISVTDSIIRVPSGIGAIKNDKQRRIAIYRYPLNSVVTLQGRIVDEKGQGIPNINIRGTPRCMDRYDVMCHEAIYVTTDGTGKYEFHNLSPASFDLAVRYFLFGRIMKDTFPSEKIFDFSISTRYLDEEHRKNIWKRVSVPLITQNNYDGLEKTAAAIRKLAVGSSMELILSANQDAIKKTLPVSTNNVIYVGDIILPNPKVKKE